MNIQVEDISDTRKTVTVTVTRDEIAEKEGVLVGQFVQQAKIPGFRPGKAPRDMVKKRFKKELEKEVQQKTVSEAYQHVIDESGLKIINLVELADPEFPADADTALTFTFDVKPEFTMPTYKGLALEVPGTEVTDDELKQARDHYLNQRAEYNEVDRAAAKGDYVKVSYEGKIGDDPVAELVPDQPIFGTQKNTWEEAGTEQGPGVKAVVEGIIGMKAGDTKDEDETFPEDYALEPLQGKTVTYHLEVHEVREKILPVIDEEFLKAFGAESEEQFNERIRDDIKAQKTQSAENQKRNQAAEKLAAQVDFPLPESLIEQETQQLLRDFMQRHMAQGATEEQFEENKDELIKSAQDAARNRVKAQILLQEVADAEEIKVENEDINKAIMQEAMSTRQKPDDIVKELQKDRSHVVALQRQILINKALDYLVDQATVTEIEPEHVHGPDCDHDHEQAEAK